MMNKQTVFSIGFLLIANVAIAQGNLSEGETNTVSLVPPVLEKIGLNSYQDDLTSEQDIESLKLTVEQLHEARVWELSENEEKRFVLLMQNKSKTYYEGLRLTPVDILGLNARNQAERMRFARLAARLEAQKIAQNIAWNTAFHKASEKETEGVPVVGEFDKKPFSPRAYKPIFIKNGDTLDFFLTVDSPVKTIIAELVKAISINPGTALNIYLVGAEVGDIQQWANQHSIPQVLVQSTQVTLNQGGKQFESLAIKTDELPVLVLVRNGAASRVDLRKF